jgi:tRNA A-37 threonylcarbamoyl transferase component Bud32
MTMEHGHATGRLLERAANAVLGNFLVEAVLVTLIGACYFISDGIDRLMGTRLKRGFIDGMRDFSRDRLTFLRKAQIRHVFKKKYRLKKIKIKLAGGSYWLSIPCIVRGVCKKTHKERKFLAKVMNDRSALKHKYMTLMRNVGVLTEGVGLKFDEYHCGLEMGEYERQCLEKLREVQVNAPKVYGLERLGGEDYMLVMEYIEGRPLSKVGVDGAMMGSLFEMLKRMHTSGIFHGDVKLDNFILSGDKVYVFDCLKIDRSGADDAAAFDLACLLCALAEKAPVHDVISRAREHYSAAELARAAVMMDMALFKSDLDLSEARRKELKERFTVLMRP